MPRPTVERLTVSCEACGKSFEKRKTDAARNKTGRFFCSVKCLRKIGSKPQRAKPRTCELCGTEFMAYGKRAARFCCKKHYDQWQARNRVERTCERCGETFSVSPSYETRQVARFCSKKCEAESRIKRPLERQHNGRPAVLGKDGYVRIYEPNHPSTMNGGWVFEHRAVAEQELGRTLRRDEHVHHVNGKKDDNRPENLIVMGHAEHSTLSGREKWGRLAALEAEVAEYRKLYGPLNERK